MSERRDWGRSIISSATAFKRPTVVRRLLRVPAPSPSRLRPLGGSSLRSGSWAAPMLAKASHLRCFNKSDQVDVADPGALGTTPSEGPRFPGSSSNTRDAGSVGGAAGEVTPLRPRASLRTGSIFFGQNQPCPASRRLCGDRRGPRSDALFGRDQHLRGDLDGGAGRDPPRRHLRKPSLALPSPQRGGWGDYRRRDEEDYLRIAADLVLGCGGPREASRFDARRRPSPPLRSAISRRLCPATLPRPWAAPRAGVLKTWKPRPAACFSENRAEPEVRPGVRPRGKPKA